MKRREFYFLVVVVISSIILLFLPTGYENPENRENIYYEKGRVLGVNNDNLERISVVTLGTQELEVLLLSGKFEGDTVIALNELLGDKRRDNIFEEGDKALTVIRLDKSQEQIVESRIEERYRKDYELLLLGAFLICLIIFAGWTGAKAAVSFIFTALSFWKLLLPALLNGYSPILVSLGIIVLTTSIIILLVGGVTKRGFIALSGAILGVVATVILASVFGKLFQIPGTIAEYSDALLYAGYIDLDFSQMFISSIFISSAGAVMDVAMDIASALDELNKKAPHLSTKSLIRSGLNIGSPVVGSMTTTLLFAYSSSFLFVFMAFMAQGMPIEIIINRGFISSEILHTIVGSFGLVLVAPLTAIIGGILYKSNNILFLHKKHRNT